MGFLGYFILAGAFLLSGCTLSASIEGPSLQIEKIGVAGISSSSKTQTTSKGYLVEASSGSMGTNLTETTSKGYSVYHGVQGTVVSDR